MKGLAELVVSLCDLCEAEGRLLQEGVLRTVRRAVALMLGLLFGAAALAFLLAALYVLLTSLMPVPAALVMLGLASAAIAACLLWSARRVAAPAGEQPEAQAGASGEAPSGGTVRKPPAPRCAGPRCPGNGRGGIWARATPYGRRS